jgi:hypothetical protein
MSPKVRVPARSWLLGLAATSACLAAQAHHSVLGFDGAHETTIVGTVVRIAWQFPHVHLAVAAEHEGGESAWTVEAEAPQVLARLGWAADAVKVGDVVTVRGARAKNGAQALRCATVELAGRTFECFPAGGRVGGK